MEKDETAMFTCLCGRSLCGTNDDFGRHLDFDCEVAARAREILENDAKNIEKYK